VAWFKTNKLSRTSQSRTDSSGRPQASTHGAPFPLLPPLPPRRRSLRCPETGYR
jgi:hypothetical protein